MSKESAKFLFEIRILILDHGAEVGAGRDGADVGGGAEVGVAGGLVVGGGLVGGGGGPWVSVGLGLPPPLLFVGVAVKNG